MIDKRGRIASRIAREIKKGSVVNLGIGIPLDVAKYVSPELGIIFHSENGFVNLEKAPDDMSRWDKDVTNAGAAPASIGLGGAFFDLERSLCMMRGGHVNVCVLGGLQVDSTGSVANWMIPGKFTPGPGGSMEVMHGAEKVIIAMEHTSKGDLKVLDKCTFPVSAVGAVNVLVTEYALFEFIDGKMILREITSDISLEELKKITPADYIVADNLKINDVAVS